MATIDLGKIKFTWKGAFATGTTYEADDVVSYAGSSWIYVNATNKAGSASGTPTSSNSAHWNIMSEGATALTTSGDILTFEGTSNIRKPIGAAGHVLKSTGTTVAYSPESGYSGHKHLLSNYGKTTTSPSASNTYGVDGKYPWLANYAQGWIPECGTPSPACGAIKDSIRGHTVNGYRMTAYLNQNHELVVQGDDDFWMGTTHANRHSLSATVNISQQDGGMRDGDYFVRFWLHYNNIMLLTKDGDLFTAGDNAYGQLGNGKTTDSYILTKVSTLGVNATHGGVSTQIAGFVYSNCTDYGDSFYTSCYAIDTSGRLFVWGYNGNGKLGNGNTTNQTFPKLATGVSNVVSVSAGHNSAHVITTNGTLFRTGADYNGINQGAATTSWTDTNQDNVWCVENHDGYTAGTRYAAAFYLNTSGHLYGIGYNPQGQHGTGDTTTRSAWARAGGSLTFSHFYIQGNSGTWSMSGLGGTPASPNKLFYNWGYNVGGQLGNGNVTAQSGPIQPSTTSKFTFRTASTDSSTAPTRTMYPVPVADIEHIYPFYGCVGTGSNGSYIEDSKGRVWTAGYGNEFDVHDETSANAVNFNYYLDPAPWNTSSAINGTHWNGETEFGIHSMWSTGTGAGSSEGCWMCATTDGRVWGKGYNAQGELDSYQVWVEQWIQITP